MFLAEEEGSVAHEEDLVGGVGGDLAVFRSFVLQELHVDRGVADVGVDLVFGREEDLGDPLLDATDYAELLGVVVVFADPAALVDVDRLPLGGTDAGTDHRHQQNAGQNWDAARHFWTRQQVQPFLFHLLS